MECADAKILKLFVSQPKSCLEGRSQAIVFFVEYCRGKNCQRYFHVSL
jgi:hypothetical protein